MWWDQVETLLAESLEGYYHWWSWLDKMIAFAKKSKEKLPNNIKSLLSD